MKKKQQEEIKYGIFTTGNGSYRGNLLNIGDSLESRNAWLIGTFVLFIPLVIWGYSMFCTGQKALWVLRLVAVAVVSFGVSFLASRLLLTAIGVVFAIRRELFIS